MKKLITMALVASMVLSMAACGNKSEGSAVSSSASGSSVTVSSEAESTSKEQIILNDVIEDIKDAGVLRNGDVTNRMTISDVPDKEFTFSGTMTYIEPGYYKYDDNMYVQIRSSDYPKETIGFLNTAPDCCVITPEGIYVSPGAELTDGFMFSADAKEDSNKKSYDIILIPTEGADPQASSDLFFQIVKDFLNSGLTTEKNMSNVTFSTETLRFSME